MNHNILSMLGLAMKAGKIASGEFSTEQSIKNGTAYLVIVADDASENTKKHFADMAKFRGIPLYSIGNKEELGRTIGKEFRASLAVLDENFAIAIEKKLQNCTTE